jgi:C1A family cysteine protease
MGNFISYHVDKFSVYFQDEHENDFIFDKYGWHRDIIFESDKYYSPDIRINLARRIDLREKKKIDIYNQEQIGSNIANALLYVYNFATHTISDLSRMFVYYNQRIIQGTTDQDSGSNIRNGIEAINRYGVCLESEYPSKEYNFFEEPESSTYEKANRDYYLSSLRVEKSIQSIKSAISEGYPVLFGFDADECFDSDMISNTGIYSFPDNETYLGGHCCVIVGYDDDVMIDKSKGVFIVRNSFGKDWGDNGYFYMPYNLMISNKTEDFQIVDFYYLK